MCQPNLLENAESIAYINRVASLQLNLRSVMLRIYDSVPRIWFKLMQQIERRRWHLRYAIYYIQISSIISNSGCGKPSLLGRDVQLFLLFLWDGRPARSFWTGGTPIPQMCVNYLIHDSYLLINVFVIRTKVAAHCAD